MLEQDHQSLCDFDLSIERLDSFNLKLILKDMKLSRYDYVKARELDLKGWRCIIDKSVLPKYLQVKTELNHLNDIFYNVAFGFRREIRYLDWRSNSKVKFGDYKHKHKNHFVRNKEIQNELLKDTELYRKMKKLIRYRKFKRINKTDCFTEQEIKELEQTLKNTTNDYIEQAEHLFNRNKSILYKARKRIKLMLNSDCKCLFMTLTNSDDYFSKSNYEGRLRYVRRLLKKYANDFMINTDYGRQNGREHFHCVACFSSQNDYKEFCKAYKDHTKSAIYNRHFGKGNSDIFKGARYISALTNEKLAFHCVKDTTRQSRLIYCSQPLYNGRIKAMA